MPPTPSRPLAVEQQLTSQVSTITDQQVRDIVAAWVLAFSEISADLEQVLQTVLTANTRVTTAALRRSRRLAVALEGIGQRLEDLAGDAGITVTKDLTVTVRRGVDSTGRLITAQMQPSEILPGFRADALHDSRQLDAIIDRSRSQVTSLLHPVAPETETAIKRELIRGVTVGSNPKVTARRIVQRVNDRAELGMTRATVIARTETLDAYREGGRAGEATHSKVLAGWLWLAHLSPRTCPSCLARHGTVHDLNEPGPNDHPQGRCARMPLVRRVDGSVDTSFVPNAREFFDDLGREDQVAIMGRRRLALLDSGAVSLADMTMRRTSAEWRPSWVVRPVRDLEALAAKDAA